MIGYLQNGHILKKTKIKLSKTHIRNHRFIPKTLELNVVDFNSAIHLDFSFDNSSNIHNYGKYLSASQAVEEYNLIANANKEGKLYVHVYADGRARLELRDKKVFNQDKP